MLKKLFYTLVQVILIFQLILPATGYAVPVRPGTPLKLPLDNWSLGMFGVTIHDHASVSIPDKSLRLSFVDLEIMGIGFPVRLERIYTGQPHPKGLLGKEWMLAIESWVDQVDKNSITLINADRSAVFTINDQGVFKDSGGSVITKNADKTLLLTKKDGYSTLYSKNGLPIRLEDPHSNSLKYQYEEGRLARLEESSGRGLLFFYNSKHLLEEVSDDTGRTVAFRYDAQDRLIGVNRFNLQKTTIGYDKASQLSSIGLPTGLVLSVVYESSNPLQVRKVTSNRGEEYIFENPQDTSVITVSDHSGNSYDYSFYPAGKNIIVGISNDLGWVTGYSLDSNGRVAGWQKPNGDLIQYDYDSHNRLLSVSGLAGSAIEYEYEGLAYKPSKTIDSEGRELLYEYDKSLSLIAITPPEQEVVSFLRYPNGILREYRQGDTSISTLSTDSQGNPVTVQSAASGKVSRKYDALGRVTSAQFEAGPEYRYRYNDFDQVTHIFRERELLIKYSYDANGNIKAAKDAEGRVSQYLFDGTGRLKQVKTPDSKVFAIHRTENGYHSERHFPNQSSQSYSYNHAGLLTRATDPFGQYRQYKWTPSLQLDRVISEDGSFVRYKYDAGGNVIGKKFSTGESHLFNYQGDQLVAMKSPQFHQEYVYDKQGKISATKDIVLGLTVHWEYDRFGRLKSVSSPDTGKIAYHYDEAGRIKRIIDPDLKETSYRYDRSGRIEAIHYPNGVRQQYTYDEKHSTVSSILVISGGKTLFHESYVYSDDGLLKESRNSTDQSAKSHTYDPDGALVSYIRTPKNSVPKKWSYSYDDNGNMIEETRPAKTIINKYEGIGRITQYGAGRMRHDARGRLTTAVLDGDKFNLDYDHNGRLGRVELPDGSFKQYRYDPLGRLIFSKKDGEERHIIWNGNERLFEIDGEKNVVKFYNHGPGLDNIVSVKTTEKVYYHHDRLSSVRLVTNEQGEVVSAYDYTPFGVPVVGKQGSSSEGIVFAGRPYDSDLECYYVRARYYCPGLKRFLSRDPLDGISTLPISWHPYLYAANNPVNFYDPEGEILAVIGGAIFYLAAGYASYETGYFAGTVINETAHVAAQVVKEGPAAVVEKWTKNKGKAIRRTSDKVFGSGLNSYNHTEFEDPDVDAQKKSNERIKRTEATVKEFASKGQLAAVFATNPDREERTRDLTRNAVEFFNESVDGLTSPITDAVSGAVAGKVIGDFRKKTSTGRTLTKLEEISGDAIEKVAGLSTAVNLAVDQASSIASDVQAQALADAKKDGQLPEETLTDQVIDFITSTESTPSEVESDPEVEETALFGVDSVEPEPVTDDSALFGVDSVFEAAEQGALFGVLGTSNAEPKSSSSAPSVDCTGIQGSIAVQGRCICTDGLVHSPSESRCVACSEYKEVVRSLSAQGAISAAQAKVNEARACTSLVAEMQGMIDTARQDEACGIIAANLQAACQNSDAQAANGAMAQAIESNCQIGENLWGWGTSLVAEYNQEIEERMAAIDRQAEAESLQVEPGISQAANSIGWMNVAGAIIQGMQGVVDAREEYERSSAGSTAQPNTQNPLPNTGTLPPMPGSEGSIYVGAKDWAREAGFDWGEGSGQSQSNTSTRASGSSGSGTDTAQAPATSRGESLTSGGMTASACELKFCPICAKTDTGVTFLGATLNPQCNPCITRYKAKISACEQGGSGGRSNDKSDSQFQTYSVRKCTQPDSDRIVYVVYGPNVAVPARYSCSIISRGTWAQCTDQAAKLNGLK